MTNKGWWVFTIPLLAALACVAPLYMYIFRSISTGWQVANEIAKPQVSINSDDSSIELTVECSLHCKKLQPEIEINEYSSSKKLFE